MFVKPSGYLYFCICKRDNITHTYEKIHIGPFDGRFIFGWH